MVLVVRFSLSRHRMCDNGDDVCAVASMMWVSPAICDAFRHNVLIRWTAGWVG